MKAAIAALLVLCTSGLLAPGALHTEKLFLFGTAYYRLNDWARANGFTVRWINKQDVELNGPSGRLVLTTDSRRMLFNGIVVWLSHAVAARNGVAYLAVTDVTSAIAPILSPPAATKAVKHVCLDPGHGGKDPGNREGRENEKEYTLLLAQELAQQLKKAGYTVSLTRRSDTFVDLPERPDFARKHRADVFISLHFNSAGSRNSGVRGAETYCMTPQRASSTNARGKGSNTGALPGNEHDARNMLLAYEIQRSLVRNAGSEDRGVKRARFQVLREAEVPSVLIEAGFMTNRSEARNIYDAAWRRKLAQAVVTGLRKYSAALQR